jgi:3-oxoacyl-[acyl-carrier protein] reductase
MGTLDGKVALVTGASKGIGAAIAGALGAAGARVAVNYASSREGADAVVAGIKAAGGDAFAIGGNVAHEADIAALFDQTTAQFGPIDILVNNAGIFRPAPLEQSTEQSFHDHFNINVLGVLLATKAFATQAPNGGSIVNISSIVSRITPENFGIYNATKAAVDALTHTHAKELGPRGIRVNAINPGLVATEGAQTLGFLGSEAEEQFVAQTPLRRIGKPDDIASVAVFLASDEARWLTGQLIAASGGL